MVKKILVGLIILALLGAGAIAVFIGGVYTGVFGHLPDNQELQSIRNETASLILSEEGHLIGKFFAENRTNTAFEDIPEHLIQALIATEDARYFEHDGVDYRSLFRVFFKSLMLGDESAGGGSTLSQQLAKNLYGRNYKGPLALPVHKVREAILAGRLEEIYSKDELLTLYLNTVPFGENVYGIEAAAGRFFNKKTRELTVEESAVLVGILKANSYYNPRIHPENALRRRNVVLSQMAKYEYLEPAISDSLQALPIALDYARISTQGPAHYFLVQVRKEADEILKQIENATGEKYNLEKDGLNIRTTLNRDMQLMGLNAFKIHLGKMQPLLRQQYRSGASRKRAQQIATERMIKLGMKPHNDVAKQRELFSWKGFYSDSITALDSIIYDLTTLHAGLVAMDPRTGAVKLWVGGIDHQSQPYDQVTAQRQLASAFKPILYTAALENGVEPCTWLSNDSVVFEDYDNWTPRNYDNSYGGKYSMAGALAKSVNLPTVDLMYQFERSQLDEFWNELGFSTPLPESPSAALGTGNSSALELCRAYSAIANGGYLIDPHYISSITTENGTVIYEREAPAQKNVISTRSSLLMQQMMQKVVNQGTATSLRSVYGVRGEVAGKTGTSQDYADAWFGGFTPGLVMVARVGASLPEIHFNSGRLGSGSTLALPLVGFTLEDIQNNGKLSNQYFAPFPELPPLLEASLHCVDFRETSPIENFFDLFKSNRTTSDKEERRSSKNNGRETKDNNDEKEKDGLLQRLFRKKKK